MARSDSFFIRADLNVGGGSTFNTYQQTAIDLGAYVDALGKSVLRIHNIAVSITDTNGSFAEITGAEEAGAEFQLLTQSQAQMVLPSNRAIISSGSVIGYRFTSSNGLPAMSTESLDNLPQLWTNGYLVAVDQIFLGGQATEKWQGDVVVSITMECTVETMTQAAAMALALSQQ